MFQVTGKVTPSTNAAAPSSLRLSEEMDRGHGGYLLVIAPALFAGLGWWLDGLIGWAPVLMIIGGLYGLSGALYKVISSYRSEMVRHDEVRRGASPATPVAASSGGPS